MTQFEYLTHVVPFQAGEVRKNGEGKFESGMTTDWLNRMGQEGWELVTCFPDKVPQGSLLAVNGGGVPAGPMVVLCCVFKRCLGSDTRKGGGPPRTASVGSPRYGG